MPVLGEDAEPRSDKGGIAVSTDAILNALFLGLITLVLILIAVWAFNAINRKR